MTMIEVFFRLLGRTPKTKTPSITEIVRAHRELERELCIKDVLSAALAIKGHTEFALAVRDNIRKRANESSTDGL